jgi:hypothetical protein
MSGQMDRQAIHAEMELARGTFQTLVATASPGDLRRPTLHRLLDDETDETLERRMHFPVDWDQHFRDTMSLLDVYHFGRRAVGHRHRRHD